MAMMCERIRRSLFCFCVRCLLFVQVLFTLCSLVVYLLSSCCALGAHIIVWPQVVHDLLTSCSLRIN